MHLLIVLHCQARNAVLEIKCDLSEWAIYKNASINHQTKQITFDKKIEAPCFNLDQAEKHADPNEVIKFLNLEIKGLKSELENKSTEVKSLKSKLAECKHSVQNTGGE